MEVISLPIENKIEEGKKFNSRKYIGLKDMNNDIDDEMAKIGHEKKTQDDITIKKFDYYKKRAKTLIKNKIFLSFLLIYSSYFFSLAACHSGEEICSNRHKWIKLKIIELLISSITMTVIIKLMFFKKLSKIHLIHFTIIFSLFFLYSHGYEFPDHGYFNFFYFFVFLFLFNILFIPFDIIIYFVIKQVKKIIIYIYLIILIITIISLYIHFIIIGSNCDDWDIGLNNTYIENDKNKFGCQIKHPKFCIYKIFQDYQDYTKINGKTCQSGRNKDERMNLLKDSKSPFINDKSIRIGYPLTNKCPACTLDFKVHTNHLLKQYFFNNLVDMDNENILKQNFSDSMPEIEIDFNNNKQGKMIINVNYNQTLSEERKLLEKDTKPYSENILIFFIDSLSRNNALRQLKKTMQFFEKFMTYRGAFNDKYPKENFHSFQFFKYYSFTGFTGINFPFLFYGQYNNNNNKNRHLLTQYFKEKGFVLGNVNDFCDKENTRTYHNLTVDEIYDHQFILCDPNNDGSSTVTMRCLYGKQNAEYLLEYIDQFWRKYKNNRRFASIISNFAHEGSLNVIKYVDDYIYNFLNNLFNDNMLKDTTLFFLSDHGCSMPSVYYLADFFRTEYSLPTLLILVNDRKNTTYEEQYFHIHENQQTFITALDIYNTFGNILYGDEYANIKNKTFEDDTFKSEYGISLFNPIDPKSRYPKKYYHIHELSLNACK